MNGSTQTVTVARVTRGMVAVAGAGVLLGLCAGLAQLFVGSSIPEWTGNKMDPAGLGLTTIVLSLVAAVALWQLRRPVLVWARVTWVLVSVACAAVCFSTVGRLWYVPGTLLLVATLLAVVTAPPAAEAPSAAEGPPARPADAPPVTTPSDLETEEKAAPAPRSIGAWILYGVSVVVGLAVALGSLLTVLIGRGPSSVAIAAAVLLAGGLALSAAVAPGLRRRAPAMLAAGCGAGLMAGGVLLASIALIIALS
ncbi:MAG: hypothetical protein WCP98_02500 [Actinomycetes bacterium]